MQLRFRTNLGSEEYVKQKAWQHACVGHCPLHRNGGCSMVRQGTYDRVKPHVTRVARWHCPGSHCTFSLLSGRLVSRLYGVYVVHLAQRSRYVTTNLKMKREVLDAFGQRAWISPAHVTLWIPKPDPLIFAVVGPVFYLEINSYFSFSARVIDAHSR